MASKTPNHTVISCAEAFKIHIPRVEQAQVSIRVSEASVWESPYTMIGPFRYPLILPVANHAQNEASSVNRRAETMNLENILENPSKTLTTAVVALAFGGGVIIIGLTSLNLLFG